MPIHFFRRIWWWTSEVEIQTGRGSDRQRKKGTCEHLWCHWRHIAIMKGRAGESKCSQSAGITLYATCHSKPDRSGRIQDHFAPSNSWRLAPVASACVFKIRDYVLECSFPLFAMYLSLTPFLSCSLSLSLSLSLSFSLSLAITHSISFFYSLSLFLSVSLSCYLSFLLSLFPSLSPFSLSLSLSLLSLSLSLSLSLQLSTCTIFTVEDQCPPYHSEAYAEMIWSTSAEIAGKHFLVLFWACLNRMLFFFT